MLFSNELVGCCLACSQSPQTAHLGRAKKYVRFFQSWADNCCVQMDYAPRSEAEIELPSQLKPPSHGKYVSSIYWQWLWLTTYDLTVTNTTSLFVSKKGM